MQYSIISWNLNGIRAAVRKGLLASLDTLNADIICFQETKAQRNQLLEALIGLKGYTLYSNSAEKKGYAGTAILSRQAAIAATNDMGIAEHDTEGRLICAEFEHFYLVNVYVPNAKHDLSRLDYRTKWDADLLHYLKALETQKPVIACGDFNVAHTDIDLARPKPNYNKSAGFTQKEIDGMDNLTGAGLTDTFRYFNPNQEGAYTWWSYRAGAKAKNVGWRIDYFLTSESINDKLREAGIYPEYNESDHCPIGLKLDV